MTSNQHWLETAELFYEASCNEGYEPAQRARDERFMWFALFLSMGAYE
jgi:hypothetical protein